MKHGYNKKHSRAATIRAKDGAGRRVTVRIEFTSRDGLLCDEVREARTKLARMVADAIRQLPFSDFGPENTSMTMSPD